MDGTTTAREFMDPGFRMAYGSLVPGSASLVDPPLPPGDYTIEVSPTGWNARTVPAHVEAGKTTDVDVLLQR